VAAFYYNILASVRMVLIHSGESDNRVSPFIFNLALPLSV